MTAPMNSGSPMTARLFALHYGMPVPDGCECRAALEAAGYEDDCGLTEAGKAAAWKAFHVFPLSAVPIADIPAMIDANVVRAFAQTGDHHG